MNRILVVGCAGAGKSTFARRLAERAGLPIVHLDQHYWRPGWVEANPKEWEARVRTLASQPRWIMDGNYGETLPARLARADTVFHLDMPRRVCLWRVLKRTALLHGKTRPDMAADCSERFDREFLTYVWRYRRDHRPRLIEAIQAFQGTTIELRLLMRSRGIWAV